MLPIKRIDPSGHAGAVITKAALVQWHTDSYPNQGFSNSNARSLAKGFRAASDADAWHDCGLALIPCTGRCVISVVVPFALRHGRFGARRRVRVHDPGVALIQQFVIDRRRNPNLGCLTLAGFGNRDAVRSSTPQRIGTRTQANRRYRCTRVRTWDVQVSRVDAREGKEGV